MFPSDRLYVLSFGQLGETPRLSSPQSALLVVVAISLITLSFFLLRHRGCPSVRPPNIPSLDGHSFPCSFNNNVRRQFVRSCCPCFLSWGDLWKMGSSTDDPATLLVCPISPKAQVLNTDGELVGIQVASAGKYRETVG